METLKHCLQGSSLCMISLIVLADKKAAKAAWSMVAIGCSTLFLVFMIQSIMLFLRYPVLSTAKVESDRLEFPSVSVCPMNPYQLSAVIEKAPELYHALSEYSASIIANENRTKRHADLLESEDKRTTKETVLPMSHFDLQSPIDQNMQAKSRHRRAAPADIPDNVGKVFYVTFIPDYTSVGYGGTNRQFMLATDSDLPFAVTITNKGGWTSAPITIDNTRVYTVNLDLLTPENAMTGFKFEGANDFVLYSMVIGDYSSDGTLHLPLDVLGTEYTVIGVVGTGYYPGDAFVLIVATSAGTSITVTKPGQPSTTYTANELDVIIVNYVANDPSGTLIKSNYPIAVLVGNDCLYFPMGCEGGDMAFEQLTPTNTHGTKFALTPFAYDSTSTSFIATCSNNITYRSKAYEFFKILAISDNTKITRNGSRSAEVFSLNAGTSREVLTLRDEYSYLESDKPIIVAHVMTANKYAGQHGNGDPALVIVPPLDALRNSYFIVSCSPEFTMHYVTVVIDRSKAPGLRLNGSPFISSLTAHKIPQTNFDAYQYKFDCRSGSSKSFRINHIDISALFGVTAFGTANLIAYAYVAGRLVGASSYNCNPTSDSHPPDGLDNDCDGYSDEEIRNFIDDDNDGLIDEDLAGNIPTINATDCRVISDDLDQPPPPPSSISEPLIASASVDPRCIPYNLSHTDQLINQSACLAVYSRTWRLIDNCGNMADNATQVITIVKWVNQGETPCGETTSSSTTTTTTTSTTSTSTLATTTSTTTSTPETTTSTSTSTSTIPSTTVSTTSTSPPATTSTPASTSTTNTPITSARSTTVQPSSASTTTIPTCIPSTISSTAPSITTLSSSTSTSPSTMPSSTSTTSLSASIPSSTTSSPTAPSTTASTISSTRSASPDSTTSISSSTSSTISPAASSTTVSSTTNDLTTTSSNRNVQTTTISRRSTEWTTASNTSSPQPTTTSGSSTISTASTSMQPSTSSTSSSTKPLSATTTIPFSISDSTSTTTSTPSITSIVTSPATSSTTSSFSPSEQISTTVTIVKSSSSSTSVFSGFSSTTDFSSSVTASSSSPDSSSLETSISTSSTNAKQSGTTTTTALSNIETEITTSQTASALETSSLRGSTSTWTSPTAEPSSAQTTSAESSTLATTAVKTTSATSTIPSTIAAMSTGTSTSKTTLGALTSEKATTIAESTSTVEPDSGTSSALSAVLPETTTPQISTNDTSQTATVSSVEPPQFSSIPLMTVTVQSVESTPLSSTPLSSTVTLPAVTEFSSVALTTSITRETIAATSSTNSPFDSPLVEIESSAVPPEDPIILMVNVEPPVTDEAPVTSMVMISDSPTPDDATITIPRGTSDISHGLLLVPKTNKPFVPVESEIIVLQLSTSLIPDTAVSSVTSTAAVQEPLTREIEPIQLLATIDILVSADQQSNAESTLIIDQNDERSTSLATSTSTLQKESTGSTFEIAPEDFLSTEPPLIAFQSTEQAIETSAALLSVTDASITSTTTSSTPDPQETSATSPGSSQTTNEATVMDHIAVSTAASILPTLANAKSKEPSTQMETEPANALVETITGPALSQESTTNPQSSTSLSMNTEETATAALSIQQIIGASTSKSITTKTASDDSIFIALESKTSAETGQPIRTSPHGSSNFGEDSIVDDSDLKSTEMVIRAITDERTSPIVTHDEPESIANGLGIRSTEEIKSSSKEESPSRLTSHITLPQTAFQFPEAQGDSSNSTALVRNLPTSSSPNSSTNPTITSTAHTLLIEKAESATDESVFLSSSVTGQEEDATVILPMKVTSVASPTIASSSDMSTVDLNIASPFAKTVRTASDQSVLETASVSAATYPSILPAATQRIEQSSATLPSSVISSLAVGNSNSNTTASTQSQTTMSDTNSMQATAPVQATSAQPSVSTSTSPSPPGVHAIAPAPTGVPSPLYGSTSSNPRSMEAKDPNMATGASSTSPSVTVRSITYDMNEPRSDDQPSSDWSISSDSISTIPLHETQKATITRDAATSSNVTPATTMISDQEKSTGLDSESLRSAASVVSSQQSSISDQSSPSPSINPVTSPTADLSISSTAAASQEPFPTPSPPVDPISWAAQLEDVLPYLVHSLGLDDSFLDELSNDMDDFVFWCHYGGRPCMMDKELTSYHDPNYGKCFTFNPRAYSHYSRRAGQRLGLRMIFHTPSLDYLPFVISSGYKIVLHEPREDASMISEGIACSAGQYYNFAVSKTEYTLPGQPYKTCASDDAISPMFNTTKSYSAELCLTGCYQRLVISMCDCADPHYPLPRDSNYCNLTKKTCVDEAAQRALDTISTSKCDCPPPCRSAIHNFAQTKSVWPSVNFRPPTCNGDPNNTTSCEDAFRSSYSRLDIYYTQMSSMSIEVHPGYTIYNLASDTFANVGLWMSICAISVIELIAFPLVVIYECLNAKSQAGSRT